MLKFKRKFRCLRVEAPRTLSAFNSSHIPFSPMECNCAAEKYTLELLTSLIGKCIFTPGNMHNGTESGKATILNMQINVLGFRGKSQVEILTSAERGTLVNSYLHECLRKFNAKDICNSS